MGVNDMNDNENQLYEIKESEIPSIVTSQFNEIRKLESKVETAMRKAEEAKHSADKAYSKSTGCFKNGKAIEALQQATVDLAESQVSASEAQKVSFEYQEKLGKISQYLFGLGVMSLASNRSVVRQLQMKLNGASKEELSDLARQEIGNVIKQLKAQEDIMSKQSFLAEKLKQHEQNLKAIENKDEEQDRQIAKNAAKDKEQDRQIAEQILKDEEHDRLIAEQAQKDEEHDRLIAKNEAKSKEQDDLIRGLQIESVMLKRKIWKISRKKHK